MVSGPARLDAMERSLDALRLQVEQINATQDEHLADIRARVLVVLDDVTDRLTALDEGSSGGAT
jgi:hypothetical protein